MAPTRKSAAEPSRRSERVQLSNAIKVSEQEAKLKAGVTKKKRFRRPRQRVGCRLLKLPGEIRNSIYRFSLVEPEKLDIKPDGPGEPSLLRVCKSIRNEGRSIYYVENRFNLLLNDFNGADFTPFLRQSNRFSRQPAKYDNVIFDMNGHANWDNLVKWIKADHTETPMRPDTEGPVTPNDHVLAGAFGLAKLMVFLPWSMLKEALGFYRKSLVLTPWGEDWDDVD
ncbi:hypothetical protein M409DRAFT_53518 [Zasmidium cellare ATCC 36951]|uniref:F-box domain-containing protein n=1 Tax=Zasmidium cellare ATCC 36951 TaxID=1080233 RepID=A0A6A6CR16_ZASCE|nr:uncharacterized protein M409DRAFT_53518 [Zasmidium cellare ATCC 36951]KAF2168219.1 hypothetical protein M409DRAFT_53518 [Zasmidium cellare ATCC 36951]